MGKDYNNVCRQLMPAISPLLIKSNPGALKCSRAILDFTTMAGYTYHTEEMLRYMSHALMRIDKTKDVFRDICRNDAQIRENEPGHFNFPKWHAITHYPESIHLFGSAVGFIAGIGEVWYITWLKQFFKQTNKRKGWKEQILNHNIRELNMLATEDNLAQEHGRQATQADWDSQVIVNHMSRVKTLTDLC